MTNMMKLDQGLAVHTNPSDANSFVYSPGLEYVTFAVLRPFGLHLDIRFCRLVSILIGVFAALLLTRLTLRCVSNLGDGAGSKRDLFLAALTLPVLILFKNFTSDVPHPDNLHILHFSAALLLCWMALDTKSIGYACAAMAWAGLGVWTKQVAALSVVGVAFALLVRHRWGWRRICAFLGAGALSLGVSSASLLLPQWSRFYTLTLLSHHQVFPEKILLLAQEGFNNPHRIVLLALAVFGARALWRSGDERARHLIVAWAALGVTEVLPMLTAYLKMFGEWNNFGIVDMWCFVTAAPGALFASLGLTTDRGVSAETETVWHPALPAMLLCFWLLPLKEPPGKDLTRYASKIEKDIGEAHQNGKRVLLAHGTMALIRSQIRDVPLDRANSFLELSAGQKDSMAGTATRIRDGYYDRIYLTTWFFGGSIPALVKKHYRLVETIAGVGYGDYRRGYQGLTGTVEIYERKKAERKP